MAQFFRYDMGMDNFKVSAVEGVQKSSTAMLEYHLLAGSLKTMYTMSSKPVMLPIQAEGILKLTSLIYWARLMNFVLA